jgi:hypothetical protein
MVLLKSIATIMGLSIILVFRSRYYWRYTMRSITTRYERRLQLECYRFIRKIHKPTLQIYFRKFYTRIDERSFWAQSCTTSKCPRFPPFGPFEMIWYLLREHNSWATTRRSIFHFVMSSGWSDEVRFAGTFLITVVLSTVYWLVRSVVVHSIRPENGIQSLSISFCCRSV